VFPSFRKNAADAIVIKAPEDPVVSFFVVGMTLSRCFSEYLWRSYRKS